MENQELDMESHEKVMEKHVYQVSWYPALVDHFIHPYFFPSQDFEDWDDVGLNMPKPPSLLHLYRDYAQHAAPVVDQNDFCDGVNFDEAVIRDKEQQLEVVRMELVRTR